MTKIRFTMGPEIHVVVGNGAGVFRPVGHQGQEAEGLLDFAVLKQDSQRVDDVENLLASIAAVTSPVTAAPVVMNHTPIENPSG